MFRCEKIQDMLERVKAHPLMKETDIDTNVNYTSLEEIINHAKTLDCDAVINCTGLGAASICNDARTIGGRGELLHYDRQCMRRQGFLKEKDHDACILTEEGEWGTSNEPCYMIPRGKTLVVGGSYKENNLSSILEDNEQIRLKKNAWTLGIDTSTVDPVASWIGWRPCRPEMRVEVDQDFCSDKVAVIHSYGAGGSGWTTFSGVAKENVRLALQCLKEAS